MNTRRFVFLFSLYVLFFSEGNILFDFYEFTPGSKPDFTMAITTIFAMVLGIVALLVIVQVESTGYKAKESFKKEFLDLVAINDSVLRKIGYYFVNNNLIKTNQINFNLLNLKKEHDLIENFINSTSMAALMIWVNKKCVPGEKCEIRQMPTLLESLRHSLDNFTVLVEKENVDEDSRHYRTKILSHSSNIRKLLAKINEKDIKEISKGMIDLNKSFSDYLISTESDMIISASISYMERNSKPTGSNFTDEDFQGLLTSEKVRNNEGLKSQIIQTYESYKKGDDQALIVLNELKKIVNG